MRIAVSAAVVALFVVLLLNMPRGYDTGLERIGKGRPAVVLVHDHMTVTSSEQMAELDRVRAELETRVNLFVADLNHPDGARFSRHYGGEPGMLLVFDAEGALAAAFPAPTPAGRIVDRVQQALAAE